MLWYCENCFFLSKFPDFSLTFGKILKSPDQKRNSLTFPWPGKNEKFPDFLPLTWQSWRNYEFSISKKLWLLHVFARNLKSSMKIRCFLRFSAIITHIFVQCRFGTFFRGSTATVLPISLWEIVWNGKLKWSPKKTKFKYKPFIFHQFIMRTSSSDSPSSFA